MKRISFGTRLMVAMVIALLVQPWGAYRLMAADITPGYTFSSGEANVTHTKLNNSASGTINTTFYSGKSSAGADPNTAFELLVRDTSLDVFKRTTLAAGVFDHAALLNSRTAKTAPVVGDALLLADSAAGNAYKQMTWSNWFFSGAGTTAPTNETLFPALRGGAASSLSLSNMIGAAFAHDTPTNGDEFLVLTENHNRAVRKLSLKNLVTASWPGTNYSGTDQQLTYDGTRLRSMRGTNFIDGLTVTNTSPATNDAFMVLQGGALKKLFLNELKDLIAGDVVPRHYALIMESNANNTAAQTLTAASGWEQRLLNLEAVDTGGIVSLSANQFQLQTGVYRISIRAPGYACGVHQARLYNLTSGATALIGTSTSSSTASAVTTESWIVGRLTVTGATTFQVEHNVGSNGNGGTPGNHGLGEIYTVVEIWKEIGD